MENLADAAVAAATPENVEAAAAKRDAAAAAAASAVQQQDDETAAVNKRPRLAPDANQQASVSNNNNNKKAAPASGTAQATKAKTNSNSVGGGAPPPPPPSTFLYPTLPPPPMMMYGGFPLFPMQWPRQPAIPMNQQYAMMIAQQQQHQAKPPQQQAQLPKKKQAKLPKKKKQTVGPEFKVKRIMGDRISFTESTLLLHLRGYYEAQRKNFPSRMREPSLRHYCMVLANIATQRRKFSDIWRDSGLDSVLEKAAGDGKTVPPEVDSEEVANLMEACLLKHNKRKPLSAETYKILGKEPPPPPSASDLKDDRKDAPKAANPRAEKTPNASVDDTATQAVAPSKPSTSPPAKKKQPFRQLVKDPLNDDQLRDHLSSLYVVRFQQTKGQCSVNEYCSRNGIPDKLRTMQKSWRKSGLQKLLDKRIHPSHPEFRAQLNAYFARRTMTKQSKAAQALQAEALQQGQEMRKERIDRFVKDRLGDYRDKRGRKIPADILRELQELMEMPFHENINIRRKGMVQDFTVGITGHGAHLVSVPVISNEPTPLQNELTVTTKTYHAMIRHRNDCIRKNKLYWKVKDDDSGEELLSGEVLDFFYTVFFYSWFSKPNWHKNLRTARQKQVALAKLKISKEMVDAEIEKLGRRMSSLIEQVASESAAETESSETNTAPAAAKQPPPQDDDDDEDGDDDDDGNDDDSGIYHDAAMNSESARV